MARGREGTVVCEKCGRQVRRDKAVFLEKAVFTNPLERKDVYDSQYTRVVMREAAYCPSCGKHGRIYDKKKKQQERQKERAAFQAGNPRFSHEQRHPGIQTYSKTPAEKAAEEAAQKALQPQEEQAEEVKDETAGEGAVV